MLAIWPFALRCNFSPQISQLPSPIPHTPKSPPPSRSIYVLYWPFGTLLPRPPFVDIRLFLDFVAALL